MTYLNYSEYGAKSNTDNKYEQECAVCGRKTFGVKDGQEDEASASDHRAQDSKI